VRTGAAASGEASTEPGRSTPAPEATRAKVVWVGNLPVWAKSDAVTGALDIVEAAPDDFLAVLETNHPDLLLVDGLVPPLALSRVLESVGPPGPLGRPAVLLLTDNGRRASVEARLLDHADDFVNAALGEEVLLARVRVALRTRAYVEELGRKNAELEELYGRVGTMARRMGEELRLASHVQRSLLPPPLHHGALDLASEFMPVREIGGDYFDVLPLEAGRLAVAIGDVMGKGVPAALLAANLKACLRAQVQAGGVAPEQTITRVNRLFWDVTPKGLFASLFFGVFDFQAGLFEYVNAGHDHPLLAHVDGEVTDLGTGGTVLGLIEDSTYERGRVPFARDDLFVFFSDGLTDRTNGRGEMYGVDRLRDAALRSRRDPARIVLYSLLGEVQGWSNGTLPEDDTTLIVAKAL
jgi:serine phosphatase RsbU (regulator of sigma subunit)